jgi:hypothetical protein
MARKKKSKIYFGSAAQVAIIEYNNTTDPILKSKIYAERIQYPFEKLAENVLNTYGFSHFDDHPDDIKREVVSNLIEKIDKYDESLGRAFSYFTVIAKNYLMLNDMKNYKRYQKVSNISEMPESWDVDDGFYDKEVGADYLEFKRLLVNFWDKNIPMIFIKKREIDIAYAVLELIKKSDSIENFNKKALYIYIREMTGCKTHNLTKVVNVMKYYYKILANQFFEYGHISKIEIKELSKLSEFIKDEDDYYDEYDFGNEYDVN